jgi:hypothetical protein
MAGKLKFQFQQGTDDDWSGGSDPAPANREILYHTFLTHSWRAWSPVWSKPDWERHLNPIEASPGIEGAMAEKLPKPIGTKLTAKRINGEPTEQGIGQPFSGCQADFHRVTSRTGDVGGCARHITVNAIEREGLEQFREYA